MTAYGTISVRVEYRTQMTITPTCNMGSDPNFSGGSGSSSHQSAPFWAKSDHFTSADNLEGVVRRNVNDGADSTTNVTTSDESSEAVRIFATSPPDNYNLHKRFSDHYSSNESLQHPTKFRSRSNTNQSHKSDDSNFGPTEVKVGAFATKSSSAVKPVLIGNDEITDDFLDLFNLEEEVVDKVEKISLSPKPSLKGTIYFSVDRFAYYFLLISSQTMTIF